jgi:hypothetical protein
MPDQLRGADRRRRDVHHGDEVGCPKRAQRNRRFEPGIVVCHPGDRSPSGTRWGGASFPFKNTRFSGSHLCPSWYRSPVRPSSSPRLLQPGRRDRQVVAPLPGCQRHGARLSWPLARCWVRDGFSPGGRLVRRVLFGLFKAFRGSGEPGRAGSSDSSRVSTRSGAGRAAKG